MSENATVTTPEETTAEPAKTFTQEDVNQLVQERLRREREKYADYIDLKAKAAKLDEIEEASKTELQKATERAQALEVELTELKKAESIRTIRQKVSQETGVPADLLTAEDEETCTAQANSILSFAKPSAYPAVKDGGEVTPTQKRTTSAQFAEWLSESLN